MQTIDSVLAQVQSLPSSPQILPKLLAALDDPEADISRIVDLIAYDPGLTARVLQLCNSAALGGATPATDISEAVNRVGVQSIYQMVAAASGRQALQPRVPVAGLEPEVLWKHSVTAALAAQLMAQDQQGDASAVFTAALLHDAGKIVLAGAFKEAYGQLLAICAHTPDALTTEEKARFNIDHAEAGGRLLERWNFPAPMSNGVTFQHRPAAAGDARPFAAYIHLADALALLLDKPAPGQCGMGGATTDALNILQLQPDALDRYRNRTLENFEFVNALCRL
jgi:putative nucleotidyltransferase with HDIG domain